MPLTLPSTLQSILISGGDTRLNLADNGLNYVLVAPEPMDPRMVARSSCTASWISEEDRVRLLGLLDRLSRSEVSFRECMKNVHDRMRNMLGIDDHIGIITTPSGTDCEYIPLMMARLVSGSDSRIVNIVTAAGEIGSHCPMAASGRWHNSVTPRGGSVNFGEVMAGFENVEVIAVSERDPVTGELVDHNEEIFNHMVKHLDSRSTVIILHIVDSSKLGHKIEFPARFENLIKNNRERLFVVIDCCQYRSVVAVIRQYLKSGYMVMITGSKSQEGPPLSGAVLLPANLTDSVPNGGIVDFPSVLGEFITRHDVSGDIDGIRDALPNWMNYGLMMRWDCALTNWETCRSIERPTRFKLIRGWVNGILKLIGRYGELEILGGGEMQDGAFGGINTIISLKLLASDGLLQMRDVKKIYYQLYKDMGKCQPGGINWREREKFVMDRSFLTGQPVDMGEFAVLRIALGARMITRMNISGIERELMDDDDLLLKLSLLVKHHKKIGRWGLDE